MHNHDIGRAIHLERQREIERRGRLRAGRPLRPPRRAVRQVVGYALMRFGALLAAGGPLEAGRSGPSGQPEIQP